jgi:hypothetical protein
MKKMARKKRENFNPSRRELFTRMRWAPLLFLPSSIRAVGGMPIFRASVAASGEFSAEDEFRLTPQYPTKSPLEDLLRLVTPGGDEFVTEKYAFEIQENLARWGQALKSEPPGIKLLGEFVDPAIAGNSLLPDSGRSLRSGSGMDLVQRTFLKERAPGRERFLEEMTKYLRPISRMETVEFEIVGIQETAGTGGSLNVDIRYDLVAATEDGNREERIGYWRTGWRPEVSGGWKVFRWEALGETRGRAGAPLFVDITSQALGKTESYKNQLLFGADHWRTVLDGACSVDVYGNNGVAVGDFDNDGYEDFYVCQPSGLPNRLYRNRGDGTFEDATERSGVGVLD